MEVAAWLPGRGLGQDDRLLPSNEITPEQRNLSFNREMSKIIARLALLAEFTNHQ